MKSIFISFALLLFLLPTAGSVVYAASSAVDSNNPTGNSAQVDLNNPTGPANESTGIINPLQSGNLMDFLLAILHFITRTIGPIIIILMLVYIGFLFATSSVKPENIKHAREALMWTVVGALILLGSEAIALGIQATVKAVATG